MTELAKGADAVVHLAATKIPRQGNRLGNVIDNLEGGRAALDAANANDTATSSPRPPTCTATGPTCPSRKTASASRGPAPSHGWAYGIGKLADEHMAFGYAEESDLPVTILRFFGSYGERQYLN